MKKKPKKSNSGAHIVLVALLVIVAYLLIVDIVIPAFDFAYEKTLSFLEVLWNGTLRLLEILWTIFLDVTAILILAFMLYVAYFFFRQKEWQKTKDEYQNLKEKILSQVVSNKKRLFDELFEEVQVCSPPSFRQKVFTKLDKNSKSVSLQDDNIIVVLGWKSIFNDLKYISDTKVTIEYMKIIEDGNRRIDRSVEDKIKKFFPVYKNVFCSVNKHLTPAPRYSLKFEEARENILDALLGEPLNASLIFQIELIENYLQFKDKNDLSAQYDNRFKAIELLGKNPKILQDQLIEYINVLQKDTTTDEEFLDYINKINEIPKKIKEHLNMALGVA